MFKKIAVVLGCVIVAYVGVRVSYGWISKAYFDYHCEHYAGEFIYKTVDNVEGLLQMRPRDPRDYFDRLRAGDIPEDPYGHTNWEAQTPETMFVNPPWGKYKFFEEPLPIDSNEPNKNYRRYWGYRQNVAEMQSGDSAEPESKYGFTWKEDRTWLDRLLGIWRGQLHVVMLATEERLATKRGLFFRNFFSKRMTLCPRGKDNDSTYEFVTQVLAPPE